MKVNIQSLEDLKALASNIQKSLHGGETIALTGELGAGKTAFTKMLLKAHGIRKEVTSPTFVLMIPYQTKKITFYHLDLYRVKSFKEFEALGISEKMGQKENVVLIEWADKIKRHLPKDAIRIHFKVLKNGRVAEIQNGPKKLLATLNN